MYSYGDVLIHGLDRRAGADRRCVFGCENYGDAALIRDHLGTEPGCVLLGGKVAVCVCVCRRQSQRPTDEGLRFLRSPGLQHSAYHCQHDEERDVSVCIVLNFHLYPRND